MNKLLLTFLAFTAFTSCSSTKNSSVNNMVATMQVDEPIPGVCDNSRVIAILPLAGNGQIKAKAPLSEEVIEKRLNAIPFLKAHPDYSGKGMLNLIVNCHGKMVRCKIDNETKSKELDQQLVSVFAELKNWEAGTINGKAVDTVVLYSFTIENGKVSL